MKILKFTLVTLLVMPLITHASGHPSVVVSAENNPQAMIDYWTPERMRNATPMDLPMVDTKLIKKLSDDELSARQKSLKPIIHEGAPPTFNMVPDNSLLLTSLANKMPAALDNGILNEYFSSQPLVPVTADLSFPYTTIGKIFVKTPSGDKTCSAAVIGRRVVVTAAHCLHSGLPDVKWYTQPVFVPAYRDGAAPFLKWTSNKRVIYDQWASGGGTIPHAYDYAVFSVADQTINGTVKAVGDVVGKMGYKTNTAIPNHAHIIGYAGNLDNGEKMHQVTAQSAIAVDPNNVEYGSDMNIGAGGSPVIQNFGPASVGTVNGKNPGRNLLVAVVSYGYQDTISFGNGAVIVDGNFDYIYNYLCGLVAGNC